MELLKFTFELECLSTTSDEEFELISQMALICFK